MKDSRKKHGEHGEEWQLQEAKNRLSQVVESALRKGPQTITLRGKPTAVVVSFEEFKMLTRPRTSLVQFFQESPLRGVELDVTRSSEPSREVEL